MTATKNAPELTFDCKVEVKGQIKTIISPQGGKRLNLDMTAINQIALYDDESAILEKMRVWGGKCDRFGMTFTHDELVCLKALTVRCEEASQPIPEPVPEITVSTPTANLDVKPALVEEKPAAPVLTALEHHAATVEVPEEDGGEYTGGPKKRKRKTDPDMLAITKAVTARMRSVGLDAMEHRVSQLEKAAAFFNEEIEEVQYDIPTPIRAEIPEPTRVIRSVGGVMITESVAMAKKKDIPLLQPYFSILDRYAEGTENALRLGCHAEYDHIEVSYGSREKLKQRVSRKTDKLLREMHTSLIKAIAKADDDLKAAMGNENLTLRDMERAQSECDNSYRAAIRTAAEKLNVALMHCEQYDTNMETRDLFKSMRAAVASQRDSFNAACLKRSANGVRV